MRALLIGFGVTNQAVADALQKRGHEFVVVDDKDFGGTPDVATYERLIGDVDVVIPSPGVGDVHVALDLAAGAASRCAASSTSPPSGTIVRCSPSPARTARRP